MKKKIFPKTNRECENTRCEKCGFMKYFYETKNGKREWMGGECKAPEFKK